MDSLPPLTPAQRQFLDTSYLHLRKDPALIGKKFSLKRLKNKKGCAQFGMTRIPIGLTDGDLFALARFGYLKVFADSKEIVFTRKLLELSGEPKKLPAAKKKSEPPSPEMQVFRINVIQVYAWLVTSLIAAIFSLFLLWLTIQQIIAGNLSTTVASAVSTLITSLLSGVFFKNYDKANDRLKNTRVQPASDLPMQKVASREDEHPERSPR